MESNPAPIHSDQANSIQRKIQSTVVNFLTFFPLFVLSYSTGWREGVDDKGTGPGLLNAAKLVVDLNARGIEIVSGLHVPAGSDWKLFLTKISSRFSNCRVFVCLLTKGDQSLL